MACSEVECIWLTNYLTFSGGSAGGRNCCRLSIVFAAIVFFFQSFFRFPETFEQHFQALSNDARTVLKNAFCSGSEQFSELFSSSSPTPLELFFDSSRGIKQFFSLTASLRIFYYSETLLGEALVLRRLTRNTSELSAPSGAPHSGTNLVVSTQCVS